MFAYGHKYLKGKGNLVLVYPKTEKFTEAIEYCFNFSGGLKLWVVPFDVSTDIDNEVERLKHVNYIINVLST